MTKQTREILDRLSGDYPALDEDQEADLLFRNRSDPEELRRLLVFHNVHLIFWLMKKFRIKEDRKDEFVSDCFLGLQKAALGFRPSDGRRFGNYALTVMKNEVFASWRRERTYEDRYRPVYVDAGRPGLSGENPDPEAVEAWVMRKADPCYGKPDGDPGSGFDDEDMTKKIMSFVRGTPELSDNAKRVFGLLYRNSMNAGEVARITGRSRQRINQIKDRVLKVVREGFGQAKTGSGFPV